MKTLDRKLWRDLRTLRGPAIAILLILACGVASFVAVFTAYRGLKGSRDAYYERYRMADLWAPVKRAPRALLERLEGVAGIRRVEARISFEVTLDVAEADLPSTARVVSVPDRPQGSLNDLHLVRGRWFDGDGDREVIVAEKFALVHGLGPGDRIAVLLNNRKVRLRIVGTAQSPEFVYMIRGGGDMLPDPENFTVLWVSRTFAEAVFDFGDSANEFVASLAPGAREEEVIDACDRLLDRYGSLGAYARRDQLSSRFLADEIRGLQGLATMVPAIFLGVAAFVLHMLLRRLVRTQRTQIAVFRAFGYSTGSVVSYYLKFALLVGVGGALLGAGFGLWMGRGLIGVYREFYSFPILHFEVDGLVLGLALSFSLGAALVGAGGAALGAARLVPAEGLRPESPPLYRRILAERVPALWRRLGFAARMVLRRVIRAKWRSAATVLGVAFSAAIVMLSFFPPDSTAVIIDHQYRLTERQQVRVGFESERGRGALHELRSLEGVRAVEPEFGVAVRLRHGWRMRRTAIQGLEAGQTLRGLLDRDLRAVPLPRDGLLLSAKLADLLGVGVGDEVAVEVLTGRKPRFLAPVENVVEEHTGTFAYADLSRLSRWVGEEMALTSALLTVDGPALRDLGGRLKRIPAVAAVSLKERNVRMFRDTIEATQDIMTFVLILFAGIIAFGVIYNSARIAFAERERELGSMLVLGFTHREAAIVLIGENLLLAALGTIPGIGIGAYFCWLLTRLYDTDLFRFPFVLHPRTIFWTLLTVLGFALLANLAVARRLRSIDLVAVLKTTE